MQYSVGLTSMQSSIKAGFTPCRSLGVALSGRRRVRAQNLSVRAPTNGTSRELSSCSALSCAYLLRPSPAWSGSLYNVKKSQVVAAYNAETSTPVDVDDPLEANKRAQVSKRLERTAGYFRRLGSLGFWGQLVCTVVSAIILAFSIVVSGAATAPVTLYLTTAGIVAAFLSVFWSFGYMRLSQRLRATIDDPTKAPPRAQVVKNLKNGIVINLLGMGATLLGMQATVGVLVAKALTSSAQPFLQGQGYSPVLALDVFVVQASTNAICSHFLGLVFSLELLRSVTLSQPPPESVLPKPV
ncbi:hypothetical protein R1sor_007488 [Riccia sorocarpa]|uniref:Protein TIC 21, chloroplastic n=1 Tax=Riccia sorocarpa TaxID=122646 RepID=A0ABD3HU29_9MARC